MIYLEKIKSKVQWLILACCMMSCASYPLTQKSWHTSPSNNPRSSTFYPVVEWSEIQKIKPGLSLIKAKKILRDVAYYHHPINAIVYTFHQKKNYEVAFKLSSDQKTIEDISYKLIPKP